VQRRQHPVALGRIVREAVLELGVGGQGGTATEGGPTGMGGFNGGGQGTTYNGEISAGGGGASDVRIGGRQNACASTAVCGFGDRVVVGSGGSGGGDVTDSNGGAGGRLTGQPALAGGTQETGGSCMKTGVFDSGKNAFTNLTRGSGGGWYGGCNQGSTGGGGVACRSHLAAHEWDVRPPRADEAAASRQALGLTGRLANDYPYPAF
jgi:hypothetical protein